MKKIPFWIIIGIISSIIILISSSYLYNNQEQKYKETIKEEIAEILEIDRKYYDQKKSRSYTIVNIIVDNIEYQVKLSGTDHYPGNIIKVYKFKDHYYQSIYDITYISKPFTFYLMILSAFALAIFFPVQIIGHLSEKQTINN